MKVVVTSDTHFPGRGKQLPVPLLQECQSADLIIHAGDWVSIDVYRRLAECAEVIGVHGNMDDERIRDQFREKELVRIKGFDIGVVHGHGENKTTEKRALEAFEGNDPDIIIFGHSHIPMIRYFNKVMLMNPGSPADKRRLPYFSYGILHIEEKGFRAEIVTFGK